MTKCAVDRWISESASARDVAAAADNIRWKVQELSRALGRGDAIGTLPCFAELGSALDDQLAAHNESIGTEGDK